MAKVGTFTRASVLTHGIAGCIELALLPTEMQSGRAVALVLGYAGTSVDTWRVATGNSLGLDCPVADGARAVELTEAHQRPSEFPDTRPIGSTRWVTYRWFFASSCLVAYGLTPSSTTRRVAERTVKGCVAERKNPIEYAVLHRQVDAGYEFGVYLRHVHFREL